MERRRYEKFVALLLDGDVRSHLFDIQKLHRVFKWRIEWFPGGEALCRLCLMDFSLFRECDALRGEMGNERICIGRLPHAGPNATCLLLAELLREVRRRRRGAISTRAGQVNR